MLHLIIKDKNCVLGDIDILPQNTIYDLKLEIMKLNKQPDDNFFVVFQGIVLIDERSIGSYNIHTNATLYVSYPSNYSKPKDTEVKKKKNTTNDLQKQFAKLVSDVISKNPDAYLGLLKNNPEFKRMAEENPQLQHTLNDEDLLSGQLSMMINPENSDIMARSIDRMMNSVETMPGGFQALNHGMHQFDPLMDNMLEQFGMGKKKIPTKIVESKASKPSDQPLPNITNQFRNENMFPFNLFGYQLETENDPQVPEITECDTQTDEATQKIVNGIQKCIENGFNILDLPGTEGIRELFNNYTEIKYKSELKELEEMGFLNRDKNIIALEKSKGDLSSAIDYVSKIS